MNARDLNSLGAALVAYRGVVQRAGAQIEEAARLSHDGNRVIEAAGWAPPAWAAPDRFRARDRLLDGGKAVLGRVLDGWTAPDLETVAGVDLDDRALEQAVFQAWARFRAAAGAALIEYAVHGDVYPRHLEDGTAWRRVAPGAWPDEAAALLPVARETLTDHAVLWLALAARADGATFLVRRAA